MSRGSCSNGAPPGDRRGRRRGREDLLARHGTECPTVTGAGTGTFEFESASGAYTELQCGSYIFVDADHGRNLDRTTARRPRPSSQAFSCGRR
jgi:D-serine deaminase-like pyridoxal phosphate-dependent protein